MKMLLYAGASDEDIKRQTRDIHPTLRLRSNGQELDPEILVGKRIMIVKNNAVLGHIIEVEEDERRIEEP